MKRLAKRSDKPVSDVTQLYSLLSDHKMQKQMGNSIIKSFIKDALMRKLGVGRRPGDNAWGYYWYREPTVWVKILPPSWIDRGSTPLKNVARNRKTDIAIKKNITKLSKEEKRIATELGIIKSKT